MKSCLGSSARFFTEAKRGPARLSSRRVFPGRVGRFVVGCLLVSTATAVTAVAMFVPSATAATPMPSSTSVGLIPAAGPVPAQGSQGVMPTTSDVSGRPDESFDRFSFSDVPLNQITPDTLSRYDTVALIQVPTTELSAAAKAALAQFVANGGKLIIHDSDETTGNDYSWLLPGPYSSRIGASCTNCGLTSGTSKITQDSALISANPADASYVNLAELAKYTDALGDANLFVSDDPRWFAAAVGTNGHNEAGAQLAYATNNGLIIYNGFDTDLIKPNASDPFRCVPSYLPCPANAQPSVDWLAQMWYSELSLGWGSSGSNGLPQSTPVSSIGTPIPPAQTGLPGNGRCVAKRSLLLRLRNLARHHHNVVQIDVYVKGRHVLRERTGHFHNVTLRRLPKTGSFVVKIVATTKRHYHLISKARYHACD